MIKVLHADTLGEYYGIISYIENELRQKAERKKKQRAEKPINDLIEAKDDGKSHLLWFRGEAQIKFSLIPSHFRQNRMMVNDGGWRQYSNLHYAEEIRMHHFNAKNYQFLAQKPSSRIEWLELMQHYGTQARVLDWSESSTHSLLFALEPFCSNMSDKDISAWTPCVWVLEPQGLNKDIFLALGEDLELQREILNRADLGVKERKKIMTNLSRFLTEKNLDEYMGDENAKHIGFIMNLSAIDDELLKESNMMKILAKSNSGVNPMWVFLSIIYSEGYILKKRTLPPLAIVQPYHSERIKTQHGVFTVFPYYEEMSNDKRNFLKLLNINPDSMSFNKIAQRHLYKIVLRQPQEIARELLMNGVSRSWLYPEMPIVSGEIERRWVT